MDCKPVPLEQKLKSQFHFLKCKFVPSCIATFLPDTNLSQSKLHMRICLGTDPLNYTILSFNVNNFSTELYH